MKKIILIILLVLLIPINVMGLTVTARDAILMDQDSGRILYSKNINDQRLIASITKIMTAIIAVESNKLNKTVTVGEEVLKSYGSNIYVELNEKMKLIDLVYGLMLKSGNDSSMVIAKYIGGTEEKFVQMMNNKAKELKMNNTTFANPHGLDEVTQNYSTAYDMAKLMSYAMKNKTFKKIVATKKHIVKTNYKSYEWINKNKLLFSYEYTTGGKTGYTERANKTLVTTASKDNLNLVVVTLDDGNQYETHKQLFEYGFSNYKNYLILDKNNFRIIDENFYRGNLFIKSNFYYPIKDDEVDKVNSRISLKKESNYRKNKKVGEINIYLNNNLLTKEDIYVKYKKEKSNIFSKLINIFK
jgi:serine-type D-Ala-D-Ala carboxypeptidase (penicillin-binding protein 5/6)